MDETTRSWNERESKRETHAHNHQLESDWKKAREKEEENWRKCMWYQSAATKIRPAPLSVKIDSDITCIFTGWWDPFSRMGERERDREGGRLWKRIRELEVLLASVKESEKKGKGEWKQWERKRERAVKARKNPCFEEGRKTQRQRKNYRVRESEEKWNQNNRVRKKQGRTESTMWHWLHT